MHDMNSFNYSKVKKMKIVCLCAICVLCFSCNSTKWEYKVVKVKGADKDVSKFNSQRFDVSDEALTAFGKEGWELVGLYELTETVHPNFGKEEYVTGLQPNVRTSELNFVFKRKK